MADITGTSRVYVQEVAPSANDYPNDLYSRPKPGDLWLKMSVPQVSVFLNNAWRVITIT